MFVVAPNLFVYLRPALLRLLYLFAHLFVTFIILPASRACTLSNLHLPLSTTTLAALSQTLPKIGNGSPFPSRSPKPSRAKAGVGRARVRKGKGREREGRGQTLKI